MSVRDVDRPVDIDTLEEMFSSAGPYPWTAARDVRLALRELRQTRGLVTVRGALETLRAETHRVVVARTERDVALAEIVTLRARLVAVEAARDEACRLLDGCIVELAALEEDPSMLDGHRHIATQCRNAGKETSR